MARQCHQLQQPSAVTEVLFDNGQARLIRRRQTIEELLALELL